MDAKVLGRLGIWSDLDAFDTTAAVRYVRRAEELGFEALWVPEIVGRDPFALHGLLAGATERIALGTSIVSIWGRDATSMRMAAMTLQEASHGRFVLGLGVSHQHLAQKVRGHVYEKPLTRMREYLAAYRAVKYRGPAWRERPEPPVVIAALRERMVELAATDADGAFPYLVTPDRLRWMRDRLDRAAEGGTQPEDEHAVPDTNARAASIRAPLLLVTLPVALSADASAGRAAARGYLVPYLRTPNYQASWTEQGFAPSDWEAPGSDRLVDAMVAYGDETTVAERVAALHDAGADHVALIPLGPDGYPAHLPTAEALGRALTR